MREIVLIVISFLILISPVYACIAMPTAKLSEECLGYGTPSISSEFENKTNIIERLQQYKNYTLRCYTPDNQQGDEMSCISCDINCKSFYEEHKDESTYPYKDWEYVEGSLCHWQNIRTISPSDNDIETIADFLSNGYSVMKQTLEEYQIFLENATEINNDLSTCDYYSAVAYKNGWTGYIFNDESEKTEACANAPRRLCGGGGLRNIIWNDLKPLSTSTIVTNIILKYWWIILIIIAIVMISLFYKFKK